jgi:tRNA 2-thiocytidine biosynthesis protein TtcA
MMNLLFSGQLKTMPARLTSDDGRNVLIRPLVYAPEAELARYAAQLAVPILPCDLCGSQEGLRRQYVRDLLHRIEVDHPEMRTSFFAALGNVKASHLYDRELAALVGDRRPGRGRRLVVLGGDREAR